MPAAFARSRSLVGLAGQRPSQAHTAFQLLVQIWSSKFDRIGLNVASIVLNGARFVLHLWSCGRVISLKPPRWHSHHLFLCKYDYLRTVNEILDGYIG